ncbi:hypothetical protein QJS10_CPA05g00843 [Acorus calamus]|uniref:tRNA-uridine aminocarboxypropyltransferase n=1 Tax=Acorus calamus TaxID=4465 RepID=A0AAV9EU38_ACOCL|nr:hypothetical protein QJS10_CPA05g00843 [Acorus calamus]
MEGEDREDEPLPMLPSTSSSSESRPSGRSICTDGCDRPKSVCICAHLPPSPLPTSTTVVVLLHPHQLRQPLSTVPALRLCLLRCHLIIGRRLHPGLSPLLDSLSPSATPARSSTSSPAETTSPRLRSVGTTKKKKKQRRC